MRNADVCRSRATRAHSSSDQAELIFVTGSAPFAGGRPTNFRGHLQKVIAAGGWADYERHHLDQLTAMLAPKDQTDGCRRSRRRLSPLRHLPPEVLRKIVAYAFHAGYY